MSRKQSQKAQPDQAQQSDNILNADVNASLLVLINLSKKLLDFADRESVALAKGDHFAFAYTLRDKENLAQRYVKASEEFRSRIEEFRRADKSLIQRLDQLQNELKDKTQNNNMAISQIKERSLANTKSTLFSAQEMGQRLHTQSAANTEQGAQ